MITKEQILTKINDFCDQRKWSLKNKFKEKFAEKLLPLFEGEDIDFDTEFQKYEFTIESAYHASNIALADAAEAQTQTTPKPATKPAPNVEKPIEQVVQPPVIPDEYKEMLEYYKQKKDAEAYATQRAKIVESAQGLNEKQKEAFSKYMEQFNPDTAVDAAVLAANYKAKFTEIFGALPPADTGVGGASGGNNADIEKEQIAMYEEISKELTNKTF